MLLRMKEARPEWCRAIGTSTKEACGNRIFVWARDHSETRHGDLLKRRIDGLGAVTLEGGRQCYKRRVQSLERAITLVPRIGRYHII